MSINQSTRSGGPEVLPEPTTTVRVSEHDVLDVWVRGEGVPVVFIHGVMTRDLLLPLMDEMAPMGGHQIIHYGRRGHGGRGLPGETTDVAGQVPDVIPVLEALGIDRAHVAGHSFGACLALDMALRASDRVRSAILLEPAFMQHMRAEASLRDAHELVEVVLPRIAETYLGGDADTAVRMLWQFTSGLSDTDVIEEALPEDARRLSAADLGTGLQVDMPALGAWTIHPAVLQESTTPMLWLGGTDSGAGFAESCGLFQEWLPTAAVAHIDGVGHFFPALAPEETAAAITRWVTATEPTG